VAGEVDFSFGYGVTPDIANTLGAWWEDAPPGIVETLNKQIDAALGDPAMK
jgi:hypothetical protein